MLRTSPFHTDEDERTNQLSSEGLSVEAPTVNILNQNVSERSPQYHKINFTVQSCKTKV